MTDTLRLAFVKPPDGLAGNSRHHWRVKARSTAAVRLIVAGWAEREVEPARHVTVELVWVVADRRKRDSDNLWPLLKAVCDGLGSDRGVSARVVSDDSPEFMTKLAPRIEYRVGVVPHFLVHVVRGEQE